MSPQSQSEQSIAYERAIRIASENADLTDGAQLGRYPRVKRLISRATFFITGRQAQFNAAVLEALKASARLDPAGATASLEGGPATTLARLADSFALASLRELAVAPDHLEWLESHGIRPEAALFEDMLEYWYRFLIPLRPGTICDVGAHRGRHTLPLASLGRDVVAFEPNPEPRQHLKQAIEARSNVTLRSEALCDRSGAGVFTINLAAPEESGIRRRIYNDESAAETVEIEVRYARLDECIDPADPISFIKIDAEGGEIDILKGSAATLEAYQPIVSVEYGYPSYSQYGLTKVSLLEIAQRFGYRVFDIFGFELTPESYPSCVDRFGWDFLLIPEDIPRADLEIGRLRLAGSLARFLH